MTTDTLVLAYFLEYVLLFSDEEYEHFPNSKSKVHPQGVCLAFS